MLESRAAASAPVECDIAVIGAGIVGLATARELTRRHPGLSLAILEAESRVAAHQTSHSSGVIHAGIYYPAGSLKARLCVDGARELYEYCDERELGARRCGKLIVALSAHELDGLAELERRGRANGVAGLRRLDAAELREVEPAAAGMAGLHSPNTGVVDFEAVARSYAGDALDAGATLALGHAATELRPDNGHVVVRHARGKTRARYAVACAGLWSDRLATGAGGAADPRIVPFRGAYLRLRPERAGLVQSLIYPVPDPALPFLGVHLTRGHDDEVLIGPTALLSPARDAYRLRRVRARDLAETLAWPGTWRMARRFWRTGATELRHAASRRALVADARRYVPELRATDVVAGPAGVRAQALGRDGRLVDDFVITRTERALHVRNAPSPAATSALALARLIADEVEVDW